MPPERSPGPPECGVTSPARRRRTADAGFTRYRPNQGGSIIATSREDALDEPGRVEYSLFMGFKSRGFFHFVARISEAQSGNGDEQAPDFAGLIRVTGCAHPGYQSVALLRAAAEAVVERVAGAAHGADRVGHLAAVDGLAQPADMHVDGALIDVDLRAPDAVE